VTRPDALKRSVDRDLILDSAPDRDGEFFKVPQILGGA